jgi:hypothetical protein
MDGLPSGFVNQQSASIAIFMIVQENRAQLAAQFFPRTEKVAPMRFIDCVKAFVVLGAVAMAGPSIAQTAEPADKPILVISGKITSTNPEGTVTFTREALEALGTVSFETQTPWYKQSTKFEGVPLDKLMKAVGANGERLVAVALNDYASEIPIEDFAKYQVILALKRDGEYMPVRDKGPLFIVYPYDSSPDLKSQKFYSRSVWQVAKLVVK